MFISFCFQGDYGPPGESGPIGPSGEKARNETFVSVFLPPYSSLDVSCTSI